jgi:ABC-type Fe3+-hydroxamate transport system substrate-binding protein
MIYKDQLGNELSLNEIPQRIVSLVPSQSEYLWDLGLREELIGVTKFCIHPQQLFQKVERVGGTKTLNLEKIRELKPDLIIGNLEENEKADIEILQKEFKVWMSDIYNLDDALKMMQELGIILNRKTQAEAITQKIIQSFNRVKNIFEEKSVAYLIWHNPYMCVANNTFINHVLKHVGFKNVFDHLSRYPEITPEQLQIAKPDLCFLSSEPFPFKQKHLAEMQNWLPDSKILIVDGEMFSWYGSRLLLYEEYVRGLTRIIPKPDSTALDRK